jgi:hypothetical protein
MNSPKASPKPYIGDEFIENNAYQKRSMISSRSKALLLQGTGYKVQGTKYRVQSTGYRVQGTKYRVHSTSTSTKCVYPKERELTINHPLEMIS